MGEKPAVGETFAIEIDWERRHRLMRLHTALHLLGLDHTRLTYRFQGRDYRLTDVHGEVVKDILA